MKHHWLFWLLGISFSTGGRLPDDPTTRDYANLIGKAEVSVLIVSGKLLPSVYASKQFLRSVNEAVRKGIPVEILVGPGINKETFQEYQNLGVEIQILPKWPGRHFAVVDGNHVRIEEPHPESSNQCSQYIIYHYKYAHKLTKLFHSLKSLS